MVQAQTDSNEVDKTKDASKLQQNNAFSVPITASDLTSRSSESSIEFANVNNANDKG